MKSAAIASLLLAAPLQQDVERHLEALGGNDAKAARAASEALRRSIDPGRAADVLRIFKSVPPRQAWTMTRLLESLAGPEMVPELLDLLAKEPERAASIAEVLEMLADPRAESALIPLFAPERREFAYAVAGALATCGGAEAAAALRKHERAFGDAKLEEYCLRRRQMLRDPRAARDILAAAAAGKIELRRWTGELASLGDRSIVPDLVALVKDPATKIEPRKAALELLGILGSAEQVPLLIAHLEDPRYAEAAAVGLEARADPRAAGPLTRALQGATWGMPFARAIVAAPSPEAEAPLLEMLDDPEGHPRTFTDAARLGLRLGGPKLKAKLIELCSKDRLDPALALEVAALLDAEDLERLRGVQSRHLALLRAARGEALEAFVEHVAERRIPDIVVRKRFGTDTQPYRCALEIFRPPPAGLVEAVEKAFAARPQWFEGAEYLALRGKEVGAALLLRAAAEGAGARQSRARRALLALGDRAAVPAALKAYEGYRQDEEEERALARAMSEEDAAEARARVRSGALPSPQGLLRILAHRDDREAIPLFRREIRGRGADVRFTEEMALALARMKDGASRHVFLRMLRGLGAAERALGARCLGLLGERAATAALAPLLDDLQRQWMPDPQVDGLAPVPRVCDAAAEAIAALEGLRLEGPPDARVEAARRALRKD